MGVVFVVKWGIKMVEGVFEVLRVGVGFLLNIVGESLCCVKVYLIVELVILVLIMVICLGLELVGVIVNYGLLVGFVLNLFVYILISILCFCLNLGVFVILNLVVDKFFLIFCVIV